MAAKFVEMKGINEVVNKLLRAGKSIVKNTERGMKKAGLTLQRLSMLVVPIQTGNLRGSAFTRATGSGKNFGVTVGYTASYAVFVHENLNAAHGSEFNAKHAAAIATAKTPAQRRVFFNRGVNQQAKFLEGPARQNAGLLLKIIQMSASKRPAA